MSVPVAISDLYTKLDEYPWGYLMTVNDRQRAHALAVPTQFVDGVLVASAGRGTLANAAARPEVSIVFPGATGAAYSLIVDGTAQVVFDGHVEITPTGAVLHRPALES